MRLERVPGTYAVARLPPGAAVPAWGQDGALYSLIRTPEETSLVCLDADKPPGVQAERGWAAPRGAGTLDFALTGVLASLTAPLAAAEISLLHFQPLTRTAYLLKPRPWSPPLRPCAQRGLQ